ncbi:MAG TPA: NADH-quinone oxidoreductase subunit H, partial [Gammaproteobacteria bacterium]|nr:NADH-quinone oxidoreductase subunit H [Gammaproteobacteria bacterium]
MITAMILLLLALGAYLVAVIEAWAMTGRFQLGAPLLAGIALLGRESIVPRKPDRVFFELAPVLLLISA